MVIRIAEAMDLSLRDRNALLIAAGLPPAYPEPALDEAQMAPVRRVIAQVLSNHEPYPAWSFGPGLRFLDANRAAERLFPGMTALSPEALVDRWCTPAPGASPEAARRGVHQAIGALRQELFHHPHPDLPALLRRAEAHAEGLGPAPEPPPQPVMCPTLWIDGRPVRTLSTVLRFDKAADVTTAELRVELVFPADEESEAFLRGLAR